MNDRKNDSEQNTYKLTRVNEKGSVKDWFVNLFKGFWYGLTDLFLMSWGNIVLLIFLLFVPLAYAVVCTLGYWDPVSNLGKVELPIFDADRSFIKVEDKTNGTYRMGALAEIDNADGSKEEFIDTKPVDNDGKPNVNYSKVINNYTNEDLAKKVKDIKPGTKLILNNGLIVNYTSDVSLTPMNSWESLKQSGILIKENPKKSDEDAKFQISVSPNEELHFRNIRYINDSNDDNNDWRTGKYQMQVKFNNGYGAALAGVQGIAYDEKFKDELQEAQSNPATATINPLIASGLIQANQNAKLPNTDIFQTFQRNFVSSYILSQVSEFASGIVDEMSPVINAVKDNASSNITFGTLGKDMINFLNQYKKLGNAALTAGVNKAEAAINKDSYYLVLNKDSFLKGLGIPVSLPNDETNFDTKTLLGTDGSNGTIAKWLEQIEPFIENNGFNSVNADQGSTISFIADVVKNMGPEETFDSNIVTFANGIGGLLNSPSSLNNGNKVNGNGLELVKAVLKTLEPLYGTDYQKIDAAATTFVTDPVFNKDPSGKLNPFIPLNNKLSLFAILSDITAKNTKTFFPFFKSFTDLGMPVTVNLLGTTYGAMNKLEAANGVDPSKLTNVETSRGASMGIFGIGLGQMFIFLGTFIGYSMLREILKRNKQYAKLTPRNWYLSKMLDYAVIGFLQTTITTWIIYGAGWDKYVSASSMALEWLWLLMGTMILMAVICGLQFAMEPALGSVLGIFYLAFNITCSGASYPGWMQTAFYRDLSWVMPFTYLLEGSNQIIYGINNGGGGHYTNMRILTLWGYSSCFFAFFFLIGFWGCGKQYKVSCYGSSKGAAVYAGLKKLDRVPQMAAFRHPYKDKKGIVKFEYNWNVLVGPFDEQLYKSTKNTIKKHMMFKWYYNLREKRKIEEREIYGER